MRQSKWLKIFLTVGMSMAYFTNCVAGKNDTSIINNELFAAMTVYRVPVVGYAIIKDYKIVAAKTLSIDPKLQVSDNLLFQAASISKSISAYGALKLVSQGKLLDRSGDLEQNSGKIRAIPGLLV